MFRPGKPFVDQIAHRIPDEHAKKYLRATDIQTGRVVWQDPQMGPGNSWRGVLATGGGLVFLGDDSGAFAANARTGKRLWHFNTSQTWHASPMTYMAQGKQYVAVVVGATVIAFGL